MLAESDNYIMLSSETNGFLNLFNNYISLENNDIVKISQNDFKSDLNYSLYKLNNVDLVLNPSPFKYWTLKEINEQPISIMNSINNGARMLMYNFDFLYLNLKGSPCIHECWCNFNFLFLYKRFTFAVSYKIKIAVPSKSAT